jgi:hypothetical protein
VVERPAAGNDEQEGRMIREFVALPAALLGAFTPTEMTVAIVLSLILWWFLFDSLAVRVRRARERRDIARFFDRQRRRRFQFRG